MTLEGELDVLNLPATKKIQYLSFKGQLPPNFNLKFIPNAFQKMVQTDAKFADDAGKTQ